MNEETPEIIKNTQYTGVKARLLTEVCKDVEPEPELPMLIVEQKTVN